MMYFVWMLRIAQIAYFPVGEWETFTERSHFDEGRWWAPRRVFVCSCENQSQAEGTGMAWLVRAR